MPEDTLLTPRQAASVLQFTSPKPIYRLIRDGELPAAKVRGRLLIRQRDLQALLDRSRPKLKRKRGGLRDLERRG
jgi:excisionase family DNA binding protein